MSASTPPAESETPPQVSRRRRRWAGYVLLGLIVVLGFFVVRAAWLIQATPTYWQEHQTFLQDTPTEDLDDLAGGVQSRTLREWSYPIGDGDGVRTVTYGFDEVNAWLATRLRPLLRNQNINLPAEVGEFMLAQRDEQLVLAFDYESATLGARIASLYFEFRSEPETTEGRDPLAVRVRSARAGEQHLSVRYLVSQVKDQPALQTADLQELLQTLGRRHFITLPPIPVDDRREATVLDIKLQPTGVELLIRVAYHNPPGESTN
ncbi:MAG: hypothetical protein AAF593_13175 [Planctomycetota bacterium]